MDFVQPETSETHQGLEGESSLAAPEASNGKQHRETKCHMIQ
jgi:hypothetical protein